MLTGFLLIVTALLSNAEANGDKVVLSDSSASVGYIQPHHVQGEYTESPLLFRKPGSIQPYARDECTLWKCNLQYKAWTKTNITENYDIYLACLDKCEIELILIWTKRWMKDVSRENKSAEDAKKPKKKSKFGKFK